MFVHVGFPMKKIVLVLGILCASFAQAETIDVSTLSEKEQVTHRIGYCVALSNEALSKGFVNTKIKKISVLLRDQLSHSSRESFELYNKAQHDAQASMLLGKLEITNEMLISCEQDMIKILEENYVPHFKYMS